MGEVWGPKRFFGGGGGLKMGVRYAWAQRGFILLGGVV